MTTGIIVGDTLWVAKSYVRNGGEEITVHRTKEGAIESLMECVSGDNAEPARAAITEDGYWADSESDPRIELSLEPKRLKS